MSKLPQAEPVDLTDASLAAELAEALSAIACANDALIMGDYEAKTVAQTKTKTARILAAPEAYPLFQAFRLWRDYGFFGRLESEIPSPHDGYALVLMNEPAAELYGGAQAVNCSAVLQGMLAREKLDLHLNRATPGFLAEEMFLEFTVGGERKGLTVYELALLAGMSVQSVRNELQKTGTRLEKDEGGFVTMDIDRAYEWLLQRRGFKDTYTVEEDESNILVPQARDGSIFTPACKLGAGYKIGKKGEEIYLDNYHDALSELRHMTTPYWRRPSPKSGVPGIVRGITWVQKSREELGIE